MTSDIYRKSSHDDKSINDSSLSDAIADILNSSEDEMKPANRLAKKPATSNLSKVTHSNDTAKPTPNRLSVGDDDNESETPPMPDVYLSSESLDSHASLASLSNSYEDRFHYEEDFDDYFETESNATDYEIPSICSSASPSTHDFSLTSDADVLELGHVDYLEDVTYNFVAQTAPLDTPVGSNNAGGLQESTIYTNNIQKPTPIATTKVETNSISQSSISEDIVSASENDSSVTSDLVQVQQTMEHILTKMVASLEVAPVKVEEEDHHKVTKETPLMIDDLATSTNEGDISNDIASIPTPPDTPITEDYSIDDDNLMGHADYMEDVEIFFRDKSSITILPINIDQTNDFQKRPDIPDVRDKTSITAGIASISSDDKEALTSVIKTIPIAEESIVDVKKESASSPKSNSIADEIASSASDVVTPSCSTELQPNTDIIVPVLSSISVLCNVPQNNHSVSTASLVDDHFSDHAKSTNEADFSDETYDDASSISYPEATDTENSSIDDNFLRHTDYSEEVKSCISQKSTEFLNDCENFSDKTAEDFDDTDNIIASSSHVAKDDSTSVSEKCSIAEDIASANSDDEPAADCHHVLRSTTSSFHVAKEDSASVSEASSIAEEIVPPDSDDESVSDADCMEDLDTSICFAKKGSSTTFNDANLPSPLQTSTPNKLMEIEPETIKVEPTTDLHMNKITAGEGALEQEAENNSDDTSVFSSASTSPPVLDKSQVRQLTGLEDSIELALLADSLNADNDTNSPDKQIIAKEVESIQDDRCQLQDQIKYLTFQRDYLQKNTESLSNEAASLRSKFYMLILDKEEVAQAAYANLVERDETIEALKKDVQWWTYETKRAEEAKEILSAEVEALKGTNDSHQRDAENQAQQNAALKEELQKVTTTSEEEIQALKSKIDGHKSNTENLAQRNAALKEQLEKVTTTFEEEKQTLKSKIDGYKSNTENLSKQNSALKEQLEKVMTTSEEEKQALKRTVQEKSFITENILQENAALKQQIEKVMSVSNDDINILESTVDEYKTVVDQLLNENAALKHQVQHARSLSEDEKQALKDMSSMAEELIDKNSELKIILDRISEEKTKSTRDLDELVWKHKDLEEYNILLEDLLHESDREAATSRKDSDKINAALEMENNLLRDNFHHLQSQSRKERKSNYLFGSRKLKAIQDLERRLIEVKNENSALNECLIAAESEYDNIQSILDETQMQKERQRIENQELQQELDRSCTQELDLRKELAEMKNLLQDTKDSYLDYQELLSHSNKLQVQNATLQEYIEDRRFHNCSISDDIYCYDDITHERNITNENNDYSRFETFTTPTMSTPTPNLYPTMSSPTPNLYPTMSSPSPTVPSTTCLTPAVITELNVQDIPSDLTEQVQRRPLVATPNENYAAVKWQESLKSMFENQNRQFASFQQLIMIEILDLKKQLAIKSNAATTETISCLQAATNRDEHLKLSERVNTLEDEITSLKRQITKLDNMNARNEALSQQKDSKIECLIGVVNTITVNINKLTQEKNEWKSIASECQSILQLKEQNTTNVTLIEEQYHQYKTKTDKLIDDINTDLYNKGRELESVEHKLRMSNITASQVPKLEQHLEDAQKNIDSLSSQLDEKSKTCRRLQADAEEADVAGLRQRYHNLTDELAVVEQQLKNIRQEKKVTAENLAKANLKIMQMKIDMDNLTTENFKREVKYSDQTSIHKGSGLVEIKAKTGIWAGDTDKAHGEGEIVKAPKHSGLSKSSPEAWSTANFMVVSKDGMLKTMLDEQEQRMKAFMQNSLKSSLKRSTNQIDNLRQKFNQLIQEAADSKLTQSESDKYTDNDHNDLNETMSDISSTSYHTAQGIEEAVASVSDVTINQDITGHQSDEYDDSDNADYTYQLRGFV